MSLELKTKDQDAAVIVLNLKFGIKAKERGTLDTQMIAFLIAIYCIPRTVHRKIPFWNS